MPSFDGATFSERGDGGQYFPAWSRKVASTTYHYPGTDNNLVILGGQGVDELALSIKCSTAELSALYGKKGVTGSLIYSYETHNAILTEITDVREIRTSGVFFATLHLLRT